MQVLNRLLLCCCVAICLSITGGAPTSQPATTQGSMDDLVVQSGETNGVKLTVRMKRHYARGDKITVDFTLENNRNERIVLNHDDNRRDICMALETIRMEAAPPTPMGLWCNGDPYEFTHNLPRHLDPHETMSWQYKLKDYFEISKPGGYRLSVLRTVDGVGYPPRLCEEDEEVDVGPVRFYVSDK